jgi:hypothetical protein
LNEDREYTLPTAWNVLDPKGNPYRGAVAERRAAASPSCCGQIAGSGNNGWRLPAWDSNLEQQVRCPAVLNSDGTEKHAAVTDDSIRVVERMNMQIL